MSKNIVSDDLIDEIDLTGSFDSDSFDNDTNDGEDDLSSGLSYGRLNTKDRREVKKVIRKFRTGF